MVNNSDQIRVVKQANNEECLPRQQRAQAAAENGRCQNEIAPLEIKGRKEETIIFDRDEHYRAGTTMQDLGQLAPVFSKSGTSYRGKLLRDYRSSSRYTSQIEAMSRPNGHSSKVTMELKDVKLEVDERLFSWPSDYGRSSVADF